MLAQLLLFAQEAADQAPPAPAADPNKPAPDGGMSMMSWFIPIIAVMALYMFLMRPRREDAERQKFLAGLQKNDEVLTASGIIGNVVTVSESEDEVVVKLDD